MESIASKPWFTILFNVAFAIIWVSVGLDAGNLFISILTANLVLVGLGGARRSQLALHAKLDELLDANEKARSELIHLEDEDEAVILEKRK